MPKGDLSRFSYSVAQLKESYDSGTLYSSKVEKGSLKPKTGMEYVRAYLKYMIGWLTGESKRDNDKLLEEMFRQCLNHYESNPRELKHKVIPPPLNPYNVKVTNFVINQLKESGRLSNEKFQEITQDMEMQKKRAFASHLPEVVPTDFVLLIDDPDWKKIVSIHETSELSTKLSDRKPVLSETELKLMKRCLRLYDKIEKVKTAIEAFPEQNLLINIEELEAIQKITDVFSQKASEIHQRYIGDYGEVSIKEGKLKFTSKQHQGAIELANRELKVLMDNCTDADLKLQAARFVHLILCGKENISRVAPPQDPSILNID